MRTIFITLFIFLIFTGCTKSPYKPGPEPVDIWHIVYITEILSSNRTIFADEFGDYDDYMEIYNPQDTAVDIAGFGLSDLLGAIKYYFPSPTLIQPDTVILVWCDAEPEEGLFHANFRISSTGEWLAVIAPDSSFADSITAPELPADSAFTRDGGTWHIGAPSPWRH